MATTLKKVGSDRWMQIPSTWGAYLRLLKARGERNRPKYTYCQGRLTIVSPGAYHERSNRRLSWMLETAFVILGIPFQAYGELTLKQGKPKKKGTEPDSCYYFTNLEKMNFRDKIKMGEDPPPDLAIEIVATNPVEHSLSVHAAFGVKEVWVCENEQLRILTLGDDQQYHVTLSSGLLPFVNVAEFSFWTYRTDLPNEFSVRREFMNWVNNDLAKRPR